MVKVGSSADHWSGPLPDQSQLLRMLPAQRWVDDKALFHLCGSFHRLVELFSGLMCEHGIRGKPVLSVGLDLFGNKQVQNGIPFNLSSKRTGFHSLIHVESYLGAQGHDTIYTTKLSRCLMDGKHLFTKGVYQNRLGLSIIPKYTFLILIGLWKI